VVSKRRHVPRGGGANGHRPPGWRGIRIRHSGGAHPVNGSRTQGVILADGRSLEADAVLANADLPYVYRNLLPDEDLAKQQTRKRFSCSTISFFWGVDKPYAALGRTPFSWLTITAPISTASSAI